MDTLQDKVLGAWLGLAIGDAMGGAVRGLKPETIRQCFGELDGFKDVRPFIGKGIKHYKMTGLYGVETQAALVVADSVLRRRKIDREDFSRSFEELARGGPEGYFGVFRHAGSPFRRAVQSLFQRAPGVPAEGLDITGAFLSMAVPIAIYWRDNPEALLGQCIEAGALMSRHPWEVEGLATLAFLAARLLSLAVTQEPLNDSAARAILKEAAEAAGRAADYYRMSALAPEADFGPRVWKSLSEIFLELEAGWPGPLATLEEAITRKASQATGSAIFHASQAYVLTLLPLSLMEVLRSHDFAGALIQSLGRGRAADKLGAFTGALAGALYGAEGIPVPWKTGLVNGREIKARGEALYKRQVLKGAKPLLEMESALTAKEVDEGRRHHAKSAKPGKKAAPARIETDELERGLRLMPGKEDTARWRKMQKEKTRQKRDRRRNLNPGMEE